MDLNELIDELCSYKYEKEWFEFKENFDNDNELGEYISALSNAAAYVGRKYAYMVWGINDKSHEIIGTDFDFGKNASHGEPLKHFLERQLSKNVKIDFEETTYEGKRLVILTISAAKSMPVDWNGQRFIRVGSSKERIMKYPEREAFLFRVLREGYPTIVNTPSNYQNLTFSKLFGYYGSKGIVLKEETFRKNLGLLTEEGEYNIQAQLLSDNSHIPLRVSIFDGKTKASNLFSVREFGYNCLLYTLDELLRYGDVLNIIQADERNRVVERKDVPLFESKAFNEAIINAVLHNKWVEGNEPMISVFSNRIEILSRGTLAPSQTMEGFFSGESVPVNEKLSEIFLQLHISEKSGRGVPKIVETYGQQAISFNENSIVVTIPFNWINVVGNKVGDKVGNKTDVKLTPNRTRMISEIRNNPNITSSQLASILGISTTAVEKNIRYLKDNGCIERIGSNKSGYWKVKE
ncbi:MAG TPA: transcriptional regulator [Firmicutes bacterium]|nr:transcriptional regulator [Bacillota bacterium]